MENHDWINSGINSSAWNTSFHQSTAMEEFPPKYLTIFQAVTLTINSVFIIPGGIINILVLTKLQNIHDTTRVLLLYLAVIDLSVGILNAVFSVPSALTGQWLFGDGLCKFVGIMYPITCDSSLLALTLVCLDRYVAITRPLRYLQIVTRERILICVAVFTLFIPVVMFTLSTKKSPFDNISYNANAAACLIDFTNPDITAKLLSIAFALVLIPLVAIYFIYARIFYISYRVSKEVASMDPNRHHQRRFSRSEWKATKTALVLTGAFSVAWLPLIIGTLYTIGSGVPTKPLVAFTVVLCPTMNAWWNFVIYSVMNRQFRNTFLDKYVPRTLAKRLGRRHGENDGSSRT